MADFDLFNSCAFGKSKCAMVISRSRFTFFGLLGNGSFGRIGRRFTISERAFNNSEILSFDLDEGFVNYR